MPTDSSRGLRKIFLFFVFLFAGLVVVFVFPRKFAQPAAAAWCSGSQVWDNYWEPYCNWNSCKTTQWYWEPNCNWTCNWVNTSHWEYRCGWEWDWWQWRWVYRCRWVWVSSGYWNCYYQGCWRQRCVGGWDGCWRSYMVRDCGSSYWANSYQCSYQGSGGNRQQLYVTQGCSGGSCYGPYYNWYVSQYCGSDYGTGSYTCTQNRYLWRWIQRQGCSGSSCYNYGEWVYQQDCASSGQICSNNQCVTPPDTTPPTFNYFYVSPAGWTSGNPTWSWSASDNSGGSGMRNYYVYTDWGNFWTTGTSYTAPGSASSGAHSVYVYAYDNAGNYRGSGWVTGYIDKTPPTTPSINSPPPNSTQTANFSVAVSNDSDAHSGLAACYYHVYDSGVGWTRTWTGRGCNGSLTVTVGAGQDCRTNGGSCTVYALSVDNVGNYSANQTRAFNISLVPNFGDPGAGSIVNNPGGSGNCDNYSGNGVCYWDSIYRSINVYICSLYNGREYGPSNQCRCSDYPGGQGCRMIVASDGTEFRFDATWYYRINNITWPLGPDGFNSGQLGYYNQGYCKIQMDYMSGVHGTGTPLDWVVWRDENRCRAPEIPSLIAPPNNTWINYNPTFTATVSNSYGSQVKARFDLDSDGGVDGEGGWVGSGGNSGWGPVAVPDTSGRNWRAKAQDSAGRESDWSGSWLLKKDTVAPSAGISYSSGVIAGPSFTVTLTEADDRSGVASGRVEVSLNYGAFQFYGNTIDDFTYTGSSGRSYQFRYQTYDQAGNASAWATGGVVIINRPPDVPDTVTPNSPPHDIWINYNPTFQAKVSDPDGNNVRAYFYAPASNWGGWAASGGTSSYGPVSVADTSGTWWAAYAQDSFGAFSGDSAWRYLKKDTVAPVVNSGTAEGAAYGQTVTSPDLIISPVTFTAADDRSGLAVNGFVQYSTKASSSSTWGAWTGLTQLSGADTPANFTFACPGRTGCPTLVDNNDYRFRYQVVDLAGNWSNWRETGVVSLYSCALPASPTVTESHNGACTREDPNWSWNLPGGGTIDNYEIRRSWNGTYLYQFPATAYTEALSSGGTYSLQVRAHNTCGNWGGLSSASVANIDKLPPNTPTGLSPTNVCRPANTFSVTWDQPTDPAPACGGAVQNYWIQLSDNPATNPDGSFVTALDGAHNTWVSLPAVGGKVTYTTDLTQFMLTTPKKFYFHIKARDDAWNQSGWSAPLWQELETEAAVTSLTLTNINPPPLTPQTTSFNITADISVSAAGSVCTPPVDVCQAWRLARGGGNLVNYSDSECCQVNSGNPSPFSVSCSVIVKDKLPSGFQEDDVLNIRTRVTDKDTGQEIIRESSPLVIKYTSWFQAVNGDVYGSRLAEAVAESPLGGYESWMITNDASGAAPGGVAVAANDISVTDTAGNNYRASERSESGGNRWIIPAYTGGLVWPETLTNERVGPTGGVLIHENNITINAANAGTYNGKVVYADGNITVAGDLYSSNPGGRGDYNLQAVLIANGRIVVEDTLSGNDLLKIKGGLYAKGGIEMQRSLSNNKFPAIVVWYDPSVFFWSLNSLAVPRYTWREIVP